MFYNSCTWLNQTWCGEKSSVQRNGRTQGLGTEGKTELQQALIWHLFIILGNLCIYLKFSPPAHYISCPALVTDKSWWELQFFVLFLCYCWCYRSEKLWMSSVCSLPSLEVLGKHWHCLTHRLKFHVLLAQLRQIPELWDEQEQFCRPAGQGGSSCPGCYCAVLAQGSLQNHQS